MAFATMMRNCSYLYNESTESSSSFTTPRSHRRPAIPHLEKPPLESDWTPEYTREAAIKLRQLYYARRANHRDPNVRPAPIPDLKWMGLSKPVGQMSEKTAARIRRLTYIEYARNSFPNELDAAHLHPQTSTASISEPPTVPPAPEIRTTKVAGPAKDANMDPGTVKRPNDRKYALMELEGTLLRSVRRQWLKKTTTTAQKHTHALKLLDEALKADYAPKEGLEKAIEIRQIIFMIEYSEESISPLKLSMLKQSANRIREHYREKYLAVKVRKPWCSKSVNTSLFFTRS